MTQTPYGECAHTKYEGCPPCIHDAYLQGREDAAMAVMRLIINSPTGDASLTDTMAAARGGEQEQLDHYADCDRSLGCTCGTRIIDNPQREQE